MCWDTTSYGSKDGRSNAPATAPSHLPSPSVHRSAAYGQAVKDTVFAAAVCKKCSAEQLHADGLTMGKGADIFALVSRGRRSDRTPPRESPRRAHGTLQPVWMKV